LGAFHFRTIDHLHDYVHLPRPIADWLLQHAADKRAQSHEPGWVFDMPPKEALEYYTSRLVSLIDRVEVSGTSVVLMSHALKITQAQLGNSAHERIWFSTLNARVSAGGQIAFNKMGNEELVRIARTRGLVVVDADALETGCAECFFDPTHFTDIGASRAAAAAARILEPMMAERANASAVVQAH
jgi:hypothetical protein